MRRQFQHVPHILFSISSINQHFYHILTVSKEIRLCAILIVMKWLINYFHSSRVQISAQKSKWLPDFLELCWIFSSVPFHGDCDGRFEVEWRSIKRYRTRHDSNACPAHWSSKVKKIIITSNGHLHIKIHTYKYIYIHDYSRVDIFMFPFSNFLNNSKMIKWITTVHRVLAKMTTRWAHDASWQF